MRPSLLTTVFLAAPIAAQTVHTVGSAGAFPTVQAAVDAAADGDVVLIEPGHVDGGFVVDGKSLVVLGQDAQVGELFSVDQPVVRVQNLASGQRVVLRGLIAASAFQGSAAAVELTNDDGIVWLEDVDVLPFYGTGLVVDSCSEVVLIRARSTGGAACPTETASTR